MIPRPFRRGRPEAVGSWRDRLGLAGGIVLALGAVAAFVALVVRRLR